ncbi:MAG TPA: Gfo/Idh/MocA family oxidoreductase [Thermoleophilaceae bacterium]|nr:Gfo/Idh/MocA family oxidoreductase [Thermoleophilaceae bacterium]
MALPLGIGFLGCGRATATLHLPALARLDGVEVVAVADLDEPRADEVARRHGIARVHEGIEELVGDERVELVAVCTPPRQHAEAALTALRAGRHVLVEKPLCLDSDEGEALVAGAEGHPAQLCAVGFNLRRHRQVLSAARALEEGRLGRLLMVRTHWSAAGRPPGWRADAGEGGGVIWEMGVHHLDLWRHLTGEEPGAVSAIGDEHAVALSARSESGTVFATTVADGTSDANEVELVGELGRLTLTLYRGDGPHWTPAGEPGGGVGPRLREATRAARDLPRQARAARAGGDYLQSFASQWQLLAQAARAAGTGAARRGGAVAGHASFEDGRRAGALALAAERALASGDPVEVGR